MRQSLQEKRVATQLMQIRKEKDNIRDNRFAIHVSTTHELYYLYMLESKGKSNMRKKGTECLERHWIGKL